MRELSIVELFLLAITVAAWIIYAAFRVAPAIERRSNVWGEVVAFLLFLVGTVLLEIFFYELM